MTSNEKKTFREMLLALINLERGDLNAIYSLDADEDYLRGKWRKFCSNELSWVSELDSQRFSLLCDLLDKKVNGVI